MSQMFLNVVSTFKGDGLTAATRQLGAFGQAAGGLGSTLGKVGAALASFGLISKAKDFFGDAIDGARDLERNIFGVRKVFGAFAPDMLRFAENANKIGLSQSEAAKASTFLGSVLKQSGFAMSDVTEETQKLVETGVDLATLYGYDVQEALLGMTALFRGEYDPIEKFGVAMKQSEVNLELQRRGFDKLAPAARRYQEQIVRLELFTHRASDAIGSFSEQSRNLFAAQKILTANFKDMQAAIGTQLLPVMVELTESLLPLLQELMPKLSQAFRDAIPGLQTFAGFLRDLGDSSTTTNQSFFALFDMLGRVFRIVAENAGLILQLAGVFLAARTAVALFAAALALTPFGAVATGLSLVAGTALVAIDRFKELRKQLDKSSTPLTNAQKDTIAFSESLGVLSVLGGPIVILLEKLRTGILNYILALNGIPTTITTEVVVDYRTIGRTAATSRPSKGMGGKDIFEETALEEDIKKDSAGAAAASAALSPLQELLRDPARNIKADKQALKLEGAGLTKEVAKWVTSVQKPVIAAREALRKIDKRGQSYIDKLTDQYKNSTEVRAKASADAIAAAADAERKAEELRQAEIARIAELDRLYANFLDTIKGTFAGIKNAIEGAFDITGLGGSTNAIIRNMNKLLTKLRSFSTNVKELATMGLDPALLQQIITAGPMAGARIASALVAGGAGALGQINAGFGQVGSLASEIAETGVRSLFDTKAQQNQYNITVTGGVGSGATIGKAIVDAIKDYERTSGAVWQGA
jgi:hypothetical protein